MAREPFVMVVAHGTDDDPYYDVPDWTARERIAVECMKGILASDHEARGIPAQMAAFAFKCADALIEAAKPGDGKGAGS